MIDHSRELLYPLGYLANLAFGLRFFWQWISSEINKKSMATPPFWRLSMIGNFLLCLHGLIQVQYHVSVTQACNAIISWRHLDLFKSRENQTARKTVYRYLLLSICIITFLFLLQSLLTSNFDWFHVPETGWKKSGDLPYIWHLLGTCALLLFSSRFWVQWWYNEKHQVSHLGLPFWWLTFAGNIACLLYFYRMGDLANFIGPAFNFIPTIRNLILIYKNQKLVQS